MIENTDGTEAEIVENGGDDPQVRALIQVRVLIGLQAVEEIVGGEGVFRDRQEIIDDDVRLFVEMIYSDLQMYKIVLINP